MICSIPFNYHSLLPHQRYGIFPANLPSFLFILIRNCSTHTHTHTNEDNFSMWSIEFMFYKQLTPIVLLWSKQAEKFSACERLPFVNSEIIRTTHTTDIPALLSAAHSLPYLKLFSTQVALPAKSLTIHITKCLQPVWLLWWMKPHGKSLDTLVSHKGLTSVEPLVSDSHASANTLLH